MNTSTMNLVGTGARAARAAPTPAFRSDFALRPRTVEQAIQLAVDAIADAALTPLSADAAQPFAQARAVLALLAGCYAQQIYSAATAASRAAGDPDFPWLWWEALPDASALRRFRVENHAAINRCLVAALRFQVEQKISAGKLTRINGPQLAEEASRRIVMAAFADSMELDGE